MKPTRFAECMTEETWAVGVGVQRPAGMRKPSILALPVLVGALVGAIGTILLAELAQLTGRG